MQAEIAVAMLLFNDSPIDCRAKGVSRFCLQDGAPLSQAVLGSTLERVIFSVFSSLQDGVAEV